MDTKTLSAQVEAYCREQQIMGVLRVADRDEVLVRLAVGYADLSAKTPLRNDAVFTLYSLSKPFCAIGLLLLKDEGRVDLDAHPSDYVPETADFDPRVKVRHLLRHTSGLPDFEQTSGFTDRFPPGPAEETRKQLRALFVSLLLRSGDRRQICQREFHPERSHHRERIRSPLPGVHA